MSRSYRSLLILFATLAFASSASARDGKPLPSEFGDQNDEFQCTMMQSQLRARLAAQGYSNVGLNVPIDGIVKVRASKGAKNYMLRVDTCSGNIVGRSGSQRG